jgi:lysophospholipase L1-like esterase
MGLGAPTVFGAESLDMTGWRRTLRQKLAGVGNPVTMVGTQRTGNIVDNDVEAYSGVRIDQVYQHAQISVPQMKPKLIILYAGSNDNFQNASLPTLFKRYYALVEYVLTASPRATVVVSTLMPTTETELWGGQDRVGDCNTQLRRVYQVLKRKGKPVVMVEMEDEDGLQIENLGPEHMHPTRAGYEIMSRKFFEAIVEADARGFLQAPENVPGIVDDGELEGGRIDAALRKELKEREKKKEAMEKAEEEAVLKMIEELRVRPWDGKPAVDAPVLPIPERPGYQPPT